MKKFGTFLFTTISTAGLPWYTTAGPVFPGAWDQYWIPRDRRERFPDVRGTLLELIRLKVAKWGSYWRGILNDL